MTPREKQQRVRALLVCIINGALELTVIGQTWDEVYCGDVCFRCSDGTVLKVFNDCGEYDYIEEAVFTNGQVATYDELYRSPPDAGDLDFNSGADALTERMQAAR